jgi:hypothetical protein
MGPKVMSLCSTYRQGPKWAAVVLFDRRWQLKGVKPKDSAEQERRGADLQS